MGQKGAPTPTSGGRGKTDGIEEMTKGKLTYQFPGILPSNDNRENSRETKGKAGTSLPLPLDSRNRFLPLPSSLQQQPY